MIRCPKVRSHVQAADQMTNTNGGDDYEILIGANSPSSSDQIDVELPDLANNKSHNTNESIEDQNCSSSGPVRALSYLDGTAVLIGIMIGSGVFSSPGLALERCGSPGAVMLAWCVSGALVWLCSNCYIELGGMMPTAGGDFDYLNRAYGERAAFAFAWYNFFIGKTGSQAIIATIFGRYFQAVLVGNIHSILDNESSSGDSETFVTTALAVILVIFITILNCCGVKESAVLSVILTSTKVLLVLSVFVFAIFYVSLPAGTTDEITTNLKASNSFNGTHGILEFGSSLVACLWCFDGFADANFLQEELRNPIRDLPRIISHGVAVVTVCYLLINVAYLSVLPVDTIIDTKAIAVQFGSTASVLFGGGSALALCLAFGVALSTAGSVNGSVMSGGRAFYANGRSGKAPRIIGELNRFGAPSAALLAQGVWTVVLLLLPGSNFSTLLDYFGPTSWMFYAFTASALIRLRIVEPNAVRPFRAPTIAPFFVIGIAAMIIAGSIAAEPLFTLLAFGFVALSLPFHLLMERNAGEEVNRMMHVLCGSYCRRGYAMYCRSASSVAGHLRGGTVSTGGAGGRMWGATHSPLSQLPIDSIDHPTGIAMSTQHPSSSCMVPYDDDEEEEEIPL